MKFVPMNSDIKIATQILPENSPLRKTKVLDSNLGFGQYFTDHLFQTKYNSKLGWHFSEVLPYHQFQIDPAASVLHYGQALFEGMKAFRQPDGSVSLFRPDFNFKRLHESAERLCMQAPPATLMQQGIMKLLEVDKSWLPQTRGCSLYIRPTLIGTEAFLGVRPSNEYLFFVILSPVGAYYKEGLNPISIWVEEEDVRAAVGGLGATKAGANYAGSLRAALRAKSKGYAQVLWLDVNHTFIEEVGTMNVFFVFKNEIVTPELTGSILSGGVRDSVLELLKTQGKKIAERKITIQEVKNAVENKDLLEVFGTGTAAVISPVGVLHYQNQDLIINNKTIGPVAQSLYNEITSIQYGEKGPHPWLVPVGF